MGIETFTSSAYRNGYFMGYNNHTEWENTSKEYKNGYKAGQDDREHHIKIKKERGKNENSI